MFLYKIEFFQAVTLGRNNQHLGDLVRGISVSHAVQDCFLNHSLSECAQIKWLNLIDYSRGMKAAYLKSSASYKHVNREYSKYV